VKKLIRTFFKFFLINLFYFGMSQAHGEVRITLCESDSTVKVGNLWFSVKGKNVMKGEGGFIPQGGSVFAPLSDVAFTSYSNLPGTAYFGNECATAASGGGYKIWAQTNARISRDAAASNMILVSGLDQAEALALSSRIDRCLLGLRLGAFNRVEFSQSSEQFICE